MTGLIDGGGVIQVIDYQIIAKRNYSNNAN
jgi:hypothetical protein